MKSPGSIKRARLRASLIASLLFALSSEAGAVGFVVSEVLYNPAGGDNRNQWIELYNGTAGDIDFDDPLTPYSVAWGRDDWLRGSIDLTGLLPAGATWVVGGPNSGNFNSNPTFSQPGEDLAANLQNGRAGTTDGVGIFAMAAADIQATSMPIDAVIYGQPTATTVLVNPGSALVDVTGLGNNESLELLGGTSWQISGSPSPGAPSATIPEPSTGLLVSSGLLALCAPPRRRSRTR
jgi:hypothetical protein